MVPDGPAVMSTAHATPPTVWSMVRRTVLPAWPRRAVRRLAADPHVLLAVAVVLSALAIDAVGRASVVPSLVPMVIYLGAQAGISLRIAGRRSDPIDTGRLLLAIAAVVTLSLQGGQIIALPLFGLYIPIVAMAAAIGWRTTAIVGGVALTAFVGLATRLGAVDPLVAQRGIALLAAMVVLVIGTRRTVTSLERAARQARTAMAGQRRRARQMAAVEAVGRVLAANGPSSAALDQVMDLLVGRFGYRRPSIYLRDGSIMRLGAYRGYADPIEVFDGSSGVVGRVMRTRQPALVTDVAEDPDYHAVDPDVRSEVSVPLMSEGSVIGVLNVESIADERLDESDRDLMVVVGDRISAALELARERQALRDRAALFTRLVAFGTAINTSLDPDRVQQAIVEAIATALEADFAGLVVRDPATGEDRLTAAFGVDPAYVGVRILPGEGMVGQAIVRRSVIRDDALGRADFPSTVQGLRIPDTLATMAIPLIADEAILGAISVSRTDLSRPFTPLEEEGLTLMAAQVVLALRNATLHAQVAETAVRDPLTGLWNRRQLDVSLAHLFAVRARQEPDARRPVAAILFDLDEFGAFNKQHGHMTGDAVLRTFAGILTRRLRSSDLVARYGGEEFIAVLDGASLDEARRVADEIRRDLQAAALTGTQGETLTTTVSAGCASLGPGVASFETLLEIADVGLQMAKRGGRNQVVAA